ncbi:SGNH/GDSL hydrolase family protein [Longispora urticae]
MIARLVRAQRPEKNLPYLPQLGEDRIAALFGLDPAGYRALCQGLDDQARDAAAELLADGAFAARVDRLPFRPGQRIAAVGESTTADRLSWFEILRHVLAQRRPADDLGWDNLAVSGCTSTQALTQLPGLAFRRPDWVFCMLGGNDVQRLAGGSTRLVSPTETARNLGALRDLAAGAAGWVWLTPSAVDEGRVRGYPHFQRAGLSWANEDLDEVAAFLADQPETTVDTRPATRPVEAHQEDGLHLTLAGQSAVAVAVVEALTG